MAYALGLELTNAGVLAAVGTHATDHGEVTTFPPLLVIIDGNVSAGNDAVALTEANPTAAVSDIIGQFTADRLWFVGGMMLTPDDALRSLLSAVIAQVELSRGERPAAVTISCPDSWDEPSRQRVATIVESLHLSQPEVVFGIDVHGATSHAALRLAEVTRPLVVDGPAAELPPTMASVARPTARPRPEAPTPVPERVPASRRRIPGPVVFGAVLLALGGILFFVISLSKESKSTNAADSSTSSSVATLVPPPTTAVTPARALALGVVSDGTIDANVRQTVADINAGGGVFGLDVVLVIQPSGADPTGAVRLLISQGVNALVTDVVDDRLAIISALAAVSSLALCVAGSTPNTTGLNALINGDARRCTEFLSLAALSAQSPDSAKLRFAARDLIETAGLSCDTFAQCSVYVQAPQPITYNPPGGPLVLASEP